MTDRWVCKRCFADNNETDSACQRCGLIRGAESTPADQTAWAAQGGVAATKTEPHEYEVFALSTYEGAGTYPPDSALDGIFTQVCEPDFQPYVGAPYATSEIYGSMISPSEESWGDGDRSFICLLFDRNDAQLTESLAGANR